MDHHDTSLISFFTSNGNGSLMDRYLNLLTENRVQQDESIKALKGELNALRSEYDKVVRQLEKHQNQKEALIKQQLSIIVLAWADVGNFNDNTKSLDAYLAEEWKVVSVTPMGGGPTRKGEIQAVFASLVILEKIDLSLTHG